MTIFILSAELLANKIRQDSTVKGIEIIGNEIKLSQFADDTTLFNADTENSGGLWETSGSLLKCEENKGDLVLRHIKEWVGFYLV